MVVSTKTAETWVIVVSRVVVDVIVVDSVVVEIEDVEMGIDRMLTSVVDSTETTV